MRWPGFNPAKAMHSAGLRSASRSRSAWGRAGAATAVAIGVGMLGVLAFASDASATTPTAAANTAADRLRKMAGMRSLLQSSSGGRDRGLTGRPAIGSHYFRRYR